MASASATPPSPPAPSSPPIELITCVSWPTAWSIPATTLAGSAPLPPGDPISLGDVSEMGSSTDAITSPGSGAVRRMDIAGSSGGIGGMVGIKEPDGGRPVGGGGCGGGLGGCGGCGGRLIPTSISNMKSFDSFTRHSPDVVGNTCRHANA